MKRLLLALAFMFAVVPFASADLNKAKDVTDRIRQADPPQVKNPVVTPEPKPQQHLKTNDVPSPVNKMNPTGDKDVQRGIDGYKKPHSSIGGMCFAAREASAGACCPAGYPWYRNSTGRCYSSYSDCHDTNGGGWACYQVPTCN